MAERGPGLAIRIGAFLALTYLVSLGGHVYSGDELMMARVTESIVLRGEVAVRPLANFEDYALAKGRNGENYTWYGVGLSVVAVPFYAAGMALERWLPAEGLAAFRAPQILYYDRTDRAEVARMFAVTFVNPLVTAATAVLLFSVLLRLGVSSTTAALAALAFGLTGVTWFHAKTFGSEPLGGLCLLGAVAAWLRMREARGANVLESAMVGLAAGASVLSRVGNAAALVPLAVAFLWDRKQAQARGEHGTLRAIVAAGVGAAVPLLMLGIYNFVRFGSAFETGYSATSHGFSQPFQIGLGGLLLSPSRGLLWYVPWVVLAVPGLVKLSRRDGALALCCGGAILALLLLHAPWSAWHGGWTFGPRFLVPSLPLLAVPAALFIPSMSSRAMRIGTGVLLLASFGLAVQSVSVNFIDFHYAMWRLYGDTNAAAGWTWSAAPMVGYWSFPLRDFLIMPRLLVGEGGSALATLAWLLVVSWIASGGALASVLARAIRARDPAS
jgi:hypothetical protein